MSIEYPKLIKLFGYLSLTFFVIVSGFFILGTMERSFENTIKLMKVETENSAKDVNITRVLPNNTFYKIEADRMKRLKNHTLVLKKAKLWYYGKNKEKIFLVSDSAYIYNNNNAYLKGNVIMRYKNLVIKTNYIRWFENKQVISTKAGVYGHSRKYKFSGIGLKYFKKKDILFSNDVNIWIK